MYVELADTTVNVIDMVFVCGYMLDFWSGRILLHLAHHALTPEAVLLGWETHKYSIKYGVPLIIMRFGRHPKLSV